MWKDFFYYSKSERRAVCVLLILIALLLLVIQLLPDRRWVEYPETATKDSLELANFLNGIQVVENKPERRSVEPRKVSVKLKEFNPNIADSIELLELGLSPYVVRNVLKYREKGGSFSTAESFSRIYGLEKAQFEKLKPYIRIPEKVMTVTVDSFSVFPPKQDTTRTNIRKTFKYPEGTLVDVGTADTTELKKIPGIGSVISRRIVGYRRSLGGFYRLSQLEELDCITPEMMKWFKLDKAEIRKIPINRVGLDRLRAHPYINFYQAKVIIEYRRKKGEIKSLSQIALYEEFSEKDLERLSNYITFD